MGRVSRYKKIKSFDPYSRQNAGRIELDTVGIYGLGYDGRKPKKRSKTSERLRTQKNRGKEEKKDCGFDMPPEEEEDFTMEDLVGSLKKNKLPPQREVIPSSAALKAPLSKSNTAVGGDTDTATLVPTESAEHDERRVARMLKLDAQVERKKQVVASAGRMEGESKSAYSRRVASETRQIIKKERVEQHNPEKRKRKNEFLKNKRNKKKKGSEHHAGNSAGSWRDETGDSGRPVTAEQALEARERETQVKFGEQAERPPVFRQIPRGAEQKKKRTSNTSSSASSRSAMTGDKIEEEHAAMEALRRKVQAQYAVIKAKRKRDGDFHL